MKLLRNIFIINMIMITGLTGCKLSAKSSLLVYLMSKHKADYWFANEKEISFCHAIEWDDTNKMGKMIKAGMGINTRGKDGMTFLIYSYLKVNKKSYEFLLEHGADPNTIMVTSEKVEGRVSKLETELSALILAAKDKEDPFYLKLCLEHGGNPNTVIYTNLGGRHIIYDALGSITNLKLIIEAGADINGLDKDQWGSTPLSESIFADRYDIAYYLLGKGADPEINKDHIIWGIYNGNLGSLQTVQIEYKEKVKKILEDRGFDFSPENLKKIEERKAEREKKLAEEYKKKHQNDNSSD
jgi:ankyrin repeat protein